MTSPNTLTSGDKQPPHEPPKTSVGAAYEEEPRRIRVIVGNKYSAPNIAIRRALEQIVLNQDEALTPRTVLSLDEDDNIIGVEAGDGDQDD